MQAENRLLAALPPDVLDRLRPQLELVELTLGQVLCEPDVELTHAYFPVTCIVSLLYVMQDGGSAEIALVGDDGMLGVTLFMGGNSTTIRAVVQSTGIAYRLPANQLAIETARGGATLHLLLRYTQSLMTQMTQTAACNRHHSVHQQFCRWLLLSWDRLRGGEMVMTQELISRMLGIRSEEVEQAAARLQGEGAIGYDNGHIRLLSRDTLEKLCCECYAVVRRECDRLLPQAVVR
jgi:CRP-like cAMP-binding protein